MAKAAVPGRVKTRLTGPRHQGGQTPALSLAQAAHIHLAMLDCVLQRLATHLPDARHILALDASPYGNTPTKPPKNTPRTDPESPAFAPNRPELPDIARDWRVISQSGGDLGERLDRAWQAAGRGPIVFLGADSPDVPAEALRAIGPALARADAAIGPAADGGYWALASRRYRPELVRGIDWGGAAVYDQTHAAARAAGLRLVDLPPWHDVDTPADLAALLDRLTHAREPALQQLAARLPPGTPPGTSLEADSSPPMRTDKRG